MSGEATGYVFRHSTARGATFTVHLAIADIANDAHENRLWVPVSAIAEKARVSRSTAAAAIAWLVEEEYLERLSPPGNPGRAEAVEYRFLQGLDRPSDKPASPTTGQALDRPPDKTSPTTGQAKTKALRKGTKVTSNATALSAFEDRFWKVYPRAEDKADARRAWLKAIRAGVSPSEIIAGAERYRDDPNRDPAFTKLPATWLNKGSWENGALPPRSSGNGRPPDREPESAHVMVDEEGMRVLVYPDGRRETL